MTVRLRLLASILAVAAAAYAGDGIPVRGAASDYPGKTTVGSETIAAAYVAPDKAKKLFGEDLYRHGWVVFEVAVFPDAGQQVDVSADDFRLRQGTDPGTERAATPHMVAADIRPEKSKAPGVPGKVQVYNTATIGYETGRRGGVYTGGSTGVGIGRDPQQAPPPPPTGAQVELEQRLDGQALPEMKTTKAVAGYVYFPKPSQQKKADFELMYFGKYGEASIKLTPAP